MRIIKFCDLVQLILDIWQQQFWGEVMRSATHWFICYWWVYLLRIITPHEECFICDPAQPPGIGSWQMTQDRQGLLSNCHLKHQTDILLICNGVRWPGPWSNIKTVFPWYGDSHVKDTTVVRPSYLYQDKLSNDIKTKRLQTPWHLWNNYNKISCVITTIANSIIVILYNIMYETCITL